jgi:hypothetical protein
MAATKQMQADKGLVGRRVEELSLTERLQYANKWLAFRIYTPPEKVTRDGMEYVDVRVRKVEAAGDSMEECVAQLRRQNLNPAEYEFTILKPPY